MKLLSDVNVRLTIHTNYTPESLITRVDTKLSFTFRDLASKPKFESFCMNRKNGPIKKLKTNIICYCLKKKKKIRMYYQS